MNHKSKWEGGLEASGREEEILMDLEGVKIANDNHDQSNATITMMSRTRILMSATVDSNVMNNGPKTVNSTNNVDSVMEVGRSISKTKNQNSNSSQYTEYPREHQHFPYFYAPPTFLRPSLYLRPSFRHQSDQLSSVSHPEDFYYLLNFFRSGISLPYHFPYHAGSPFVMNPVGPEASSYQPEPYLGSSSFWVSPKRCPLIEYNYERHHHSGIPEPTASQLFGQATRIKEDVFGRRQDSTYVSPSSIMHTGPPYNLTSSYYNPPIFKALLAPESPMANQLSLMYQNFPPPPCIRYNLTPPNSLFVPEENPLENLLNMLQADLASKRQSYLLKVVEPKSDITSPISPASHPEEHPESISLGPLHSVFPKE